MAALLLTACGGTTSVQTVPTPVPARPLSNVAAFIDGLHPNAAGYAVMWKVIEPLLNEALQ